MAYKGGRRRSVMRLDEHQKIPHWYNREDKDQLRSIFCSLEKLCHLEVKPESRMIREFVGSVFRRGVISFEPFIDFSVITISKDRPQGKEQDDFEHIQNMALITWDSEDGVPIAVEYLTAEPTVRYSFGRVVAAHPPVHPGSVMSSTGGEREVPAATGPLRSGLLNHLAANGEVPQTAGGSGSTSPDTCNSPKSSLGRSSNTTPESFPFKMLTKWYPELLCLPKYPRGKDRDADYPTQEVISSASNKARFVLRMKDSTEPSRVTYTYAAGMPSRSLCRSCESRDGCLSNDFATDGRDNNEIVFFPKYTSPACCKDTSTSESSPWGPRPVITDEEEEDDIDSDSGDGGGPPEVQWEEDDEWT